MTSRTLVPAALLLAATLVVPRALGPTTAVAQPAPQPLPASSAERPFPIISVEGTTELMVAPDEVWLHLGVVTFKPVLEKSVADNDRRITAVLAALKAQGIAPADMSTNHMSLAETDRYEGGALKEHGWQVTRQLVVKMRDLEKLEQTLQQVIGAGVTNIDQVRFTCSKITDKKSEARIAAMKAARDKAEQMAGALGQKVGRAIGIDEAQAFAGPIGQGNMYANMMVNEGGRGLDTATIVAGRISVQVTVNVRFELL